jgi:hypothetical protein
MNRTFLLTDIEYDTDGVKVDLPKTLEIVVPDDIEDIEDYLSDEISNRTGFCHLGFTITPEIDLFAHPDKLPQEVQDVLEKYSDWGESYEECKAMLIDMEAVGYTFDYYLTAEPYNLRKIN